MVGLAWSAAISVCALVAIMASRVWLATQWSFSPQKKNNLVCDLASPASVALIASFSASAPHMSEDHASSVTCRSSKYAICLNHQRETPEIDYTYRACLMMCLLFNQDAVIHADRNGMKSTTCRMVVSIVKGKKKRRTLASIATMKALPSRCSIHCKILALA